MHRAPPQGADRSPQQHGAGPGENQWLHVQGNLRPLQPAAQPVESIALVYSSTGPGAGQEPLQKKQGHLAGNIIGSQLPGRRGVTGYTRPPRRKRSHSRLIEVQGALTSTAPHIQAASLREGALHDTAAQRMADRLE